MNAPLPVNLMLVEDERVVAFDLKNQLSAFGYRVGAVVASGEQAVKRVTDVAPDLVLMDIHLEGEMDGIEAAAAIQSRHRIPVVFLTAYAEDETLNRALASRPFGYLVKPCEARELHATIQMALARREVEVAVEQSEVRLRLALDAASLGVLEWHPRSNRMRGDGHLRVLFGDRPVPLDESWDAFLARVDADDRDRVVGALESTVSQGGAVSVEFRATAHDGGERHLEARAKRTALGTTESDRVVGILQDVTERRRAEEKLRQSSVVFHTTAEAIVITDAQRRAVAINTAFTRITGYTESEALGIDPDALLRINRESADFFQQIESGGEGYWQGEALCHRRGGEPFAAWQSVSVVRDAAGEVTHFVAALSDVTAIHVVEEKLNHLAHHDPLTGLPNRLLFEDRFEHEIEQARRQRQRCILLFLDLDGFKVVNDTLGHAAGDELLRTVASRLKGALRRSDTLARLGGDEFVLLVSGASPEYAARLAQKLLETLRVPVTLAGEQITVSASIGIAVFPDDSADRHLLIRAADIAMYSAKSQGRNRFQYYTRNMSERINERMHMEQGLRRAIDSGDLTAHYQPQVALVDGRITGVEALARWHHPDLGMIPPARFIPVAEESGIIESLGRWMLRRACAEIAGLPDVRGRQLRLAVNVSARQFMGDDFVATVRDVLAETGFPPYALELEITESTLHVIERSVGILRSLKDLGVSVAIDDFGTGYSSLGVLRDLPIDRIKIDRSFIAGLPHHTDGTAIVEAVVALSRSLRMSITVEGIERAEQAEILERLGCGEGQGFYFSRPLPYPALIQLLGNGRHLPGGSAPL